MHRRRFLALCGTGLLALAGCQTADDGTPTGSDNARATETATVTDSGRDSPTDAGTGTPQSAVAVEYDVRAGDVPDALQSLAVTLQVVFVADTDEMTACLRETYTGPYKPTVTPIPTPTAGACRRSESVTVDLADLAGGTSIGPVTAPGSHAAGHALIVTDVTATGQDGRTVPIKGASGHRVRTVEGLDDGPSRVELGLVAGPAEAEYAYELVSTVIDSTA